MTDTPEDALDRLGRDLSMLLDDEWPDAKGDLDTVREALAEITSLTTRLEQAQAEVERLSDGSRWTVDERKAFLFEATKASYAEGVRAGCEELSMEAARMSDELEAVVARLEQATGVREEALNALARWGVLADRHGNIETIAAKLARLEQAEGALRQAHQGIAFIIAAAGGEVRVPKSVMLHDYTVTRVDSPVDDDVRFTAALSPTGEPTKPTRQELIEFVEEVADVSDPHGMLGSRANVLLRATGEPTKDDRCPTCHAVGPSYYEYTPPRISRGNETTACSDPWHTKDKTLEEAK